MGVGLGTLVVDLSCSPAFLPGSTLKFSSMSSAVPVKKSLSCSFLFLKYSNQEKTITLLQAVVVIKFILSHFNWIIWLLNDMSLKPLWQALTGSNW